MDSLTHTFAVMIIAPDGMTGPYLFPLVLGAIIPDIDILFKPVSDRYPAFFISTHGGFTHSILGSLAVAYLALLGLIIASKIWILPDIAVTGSWTIIGLLIVTGTLSHLLLDGLAYPGIPLLYPFSADRFTAGIFPGPSFILMAASAVYIMLVLTGYASSSAFAGYTAFFVLFIAGSAVLSLYVRVVTGGRAIPTLHPLRWLLISEDNRHYFLRWFSPGTSLGSPATYEKYQGTSEREVLPLFSNPEYRRMRFYSYIVTAERNGDMVTFRDPLRKGRIIFYPPYYTEITLPLPH
jgi:inner membrane protein